MTGSMKTAELPASMTTATGPATRTAGIYSQAVRGVVERFTYPAETPFITLVLYGCELKDPRNGDQKKGKDFNAVLLVRAVDTDRPRSVVEAILEGEVSRFRLAEIEASSKGKGVLKYLVRLGKRCQPSILEDALLERAAPNVIGARIH